MPGEAGLPESRAPAGWSVTCCSDDPAFAGYQRSARSGPLHRTSLRQIPLSSKHPIPKSPPLEPSRQEPRYTGPSVKPARRLVQFFVIISNDASDAVEIRAELDFFRAQFRIALERIYDVENLQSGSIQIEPPRDIEFPIAEDVLERDVVGYVERSRIDHALRFETKE